MQATMNIPVILAVIIAECFQVGSSGKCSPQELTSHLLHNYPEAFTFARPVLDSKTTLSVRFGVALIRLKDFNKDTRVGTFLTWLRYTWRDENLKWDPQDFGGLTTAYLPISKIWKPDIRLYNGYDDEISCGEVSTVVFNSGEVLWIPPATIRVHCEEDAYAPREYSCRFKFGSWVYDGFKLELDFYDGKEEIDLSDFIRSSNITVVHHGAKKNVKYYPCCKEPYPDLTFTLGFHMDD